MEHPAPQCILCGSAERTLLFRQGEWTVYTCKACGLGLLDPRPDALERIRLYEGAYFQSQYDGGLKAGSPEMKKRLSQETHRIRFIRKIRKQGHIVDVGCGMGYFLHACRQAGYDVSGIDISEDSAGYVRGELKIPVRTGAIEKIDVPSGSVDIVTMWHFLEHTPDPRIYLELARRWLKEDGLIVVDVPNYAGTDAQKSWGGWKGWQLPFHLYHFTPETVTALLDRHGFEVIRTKRYLSEYVKEKLSPIPLVGLLSRPIARLFSGHSVAVLARKR